MVAVFGWPRGRVTLFVALICGVLASGCTTTITESHTGGSAENGSVKLEAKSARVVLMPLDIRLTELTAAGLEEPKAAWTELARGHVTAGLRAALAEHGLTLREYKKPGNPERARRDDQLSKLHSQVGGTILVHHYNEMNRLPTKQGKMDWSLGNTARGLGNDQKAEFALYVYLRDSYATGGRKAAVAVSRILGGGMQAGERVGFASLVDLRTGQIIWFNAMYSDTGDMRKAEPAREIVDELLVGFPT